MEGGNLSHSNPITKISSTTSAASSSVVTTNVTNANPVHNVPAASNVTASARGAGLPPTPPTAPSVREQDQFMPIANVIRIMRRTLPPNAKISDEAKETVQECVTEFISFVTEEANEKCRQEQRKTITADDLVWAIGKLGFDNYVGPLSLYLQKYREMESDRGHTTRSGMMSANRRPISPYMLQGMGPSNQSVGRPIGPMMNVPMNGPVNGPMNGPVNGPMNGPVVGPMGSPGYGLMPEPAMMPPMPMVPNPGLMGYYNDGTYAGSEMNMGFDTSTVGGDGSGASMNYNVGGGSNYRPEGFDMHGASSSNASSDEAQMSSFDPLTHFK